MLVSSSHFPLRLMLYVGLLTSAVSAILAGVLLVEKFLFGIRVEPWSVLIWAVVFFGALNLTMFGVLGEYVWRILEEVRGRPLYVVQELVGFEPDVPEVQTLEGVPRPARVVPT